MFGPILHVVRWQADRLDDVIDWIGRSGYGLTFGIHTRVGGRAERDRPGAARSATST